MAYRHAVREMVVRLWRNRWLRAAVLLAALAGWVLVPHPLEGPVVWTITDDHGVHASDLVGLPILLFLVPLIRTGLPVAGTSSAISGGSPSG